MATLPTTPDGPALREPALAALRLIAQTPGTTLQDIARLQYNGRVLPARQTIQALLWAGHILPSGGGYRLVAVSA